MPEETRITPKPNGPLVVQGPVKIVTPDGRELAVPPRKDGRPAEVVVLCRCGGAPAKPFCYGSDKPERVSDAPPPYLSSTIFARGIILFPSRQAGERRDRPLPS